MDVKVALLVISALFSTARTFPFDFLAKAAATDLDCNNNAIHYISIGYRNYALKGCTTRCQYPFSTLYFCSILLGFYLKAFPAGGELCIDGLPTTRCSYYITPFQCYHFYWYSGTFSWSAIICQRERDIFTRYWISMVTFKIQSLFHRVTATKPEATDGIIITSLFIS